MYTLEPLIKFISDYLYTTIQQNSCIVNLPVGLSNEIM